MRRRINPGIMTFGLASLLVAAPTASQVGWKADVSATPIPNRPAAGKIAGEDFRVGLAEILWTADSASGNGPKYPSAILTLRQGKEFFADRSVAIFLMLKPGQKLGGFSVQVRPIKFGPGSVKQQPHNSYSAGLTIPIVQGVHMDYRLPGQRLPRTEMFQDRYSITLRFGKMSGSRIPGQVFLTMPDKAKSYVAGIFTANVK